MKYQLLIPAATAGALLTLPVYGNDKLEEVVVTSSRIEMPLRQIGTSVSVLTGDEITTLGYNSLLQALRTLPSVGVSNNGGAGKVSTLRIRGEDGYRTLVLMDDIDISDTSGPQFSPRLEQLLSSGIERVEVLRGPQGLMYGADAGGVMNIKTTTPGEGYSGVLSAEGGRYGTSQLAANLGYGGETVDGNLSITDYETDGFNSRSDDIVPGDDDGYENTTYHARLGWNVSDALRLGLVGRDVDSESEYDDCRDADFAPTNVCHSTFEQQALRASANYESGNFTHELAYSESKTESENFGGGVFAFGGEGELEKWSYIGSFGGGDALRLVYGVDLRSESRDDSGVEQERGQDGYYLEYQGDFGERFYLTAGVRYDDNDDFGDHTTYRVSGAYLIPLKGGEVKLRGAYGTGFRAPSLYEIAYNNAPWGNGEELDAEESDGYDLGVAWYGDSGLFLEAVYFDQTIDQQIYFDLVDYSGYLQGGDDSRSSGVELAATWPATDSLSLTGNYTYNDTEDSEGETRARRPEHMANLGMNWQGMEGRLSFGLNARIVREVEDTDGKPLDDYEVLDLNASFKLLEGLELFGRVENALDEDYEEVRNYNTGGAAAYAGVRYTF
jgi:vitamin B12 transporter